MQAAPRDPSLTATAVVVGPSLLLDKTTAALELDKVLKAYFPKTYSKYFAWPTTLLHGAGRSVTARPGAKAMPILLAKS